MSLPVSTNLPWRTFRISDCGFRIFSSEAFRAVVRGRLSVVEHRIFHHRGAEGAEPERYLVFRISNFEFFLPPLTPYPSRLTITEHTEGAESEVEVRD